MYRLIIIILTALLALPAVATNILLIAYQANYAVYRGDTYVGDSELSLERSGSYWRWRQTSKAKGFYALFSNNTLYSETTLLRHDEQYKIHNILITEEGDDEAYENARFNWDNQKIDIQHKNKRYIETLPQAIYDSHSIHLLSAHMLKKNLLKIEFNLYRRGRLHKSYLKRIGKSTLEINQNPVDVLIFEQTTESSSAIMKYYYNPEKPLLPIKIERIKPNKKSTMMLLKSAEWR